MEHKDTGMHEKYSHSLGKKTQAKLNEDIGMLSAQNMLMLTLLLRRYQTRRAVPE